VKGVGEKARGSSISGPTTGGTDRRTTGPEGGLGPGRPDQAPAVNGPESVTGELAGPGAQDEGTDRILTVPNGITLVRLACIPLFLWLLFGSDRQTAAALLLGVLGATDWIDGFVARRYHQVSTVGKVLDPVADRVLVVTAVIAITVHGAVPVWFGVATLAREVVVSGAVLLLASLGAARIDVLWVGKAGTFALMFSYPAFLLSDGTAGWQGPIHVIAWMTGIIGLILAWIAAASYIPVARRALSDGRRARSGAGTSDRAAPTGGTAP
jgi:cardiolipin synthase